ncbi:putative ADP-ribose pyrophosphatase [Hibiscus syriacus]|uniref:ADP-ribose pyrophosphatase n=1 Tax=Hibiscus syriacus TaxID=106335 RepID=A0A6A2YDQ8_HIBSY|nr:putative ADP-ribose pyrophosphatase [Hibiscus syriacus]
MVKASAMVGGRIGIDEGMGCWESSCTWDIGILGVVHWCAATRLEMVKVWVWDLKKRCASTWDTGGVCASRGAWAPGNGMTVNYWDDIWVPRLGHLCYYAINSSPTDKELHPISFVNATDHLVWGLTLDSIYHVNSAYSKLLESEWCTVDSRWKSVWSLRIPQRIRRSSTSFETALELDNFGTLFFLLLSLSWAKCFDNLGSKTSSKHSGNRCKPGGAVRDSACDWLIGFSKNIGVSSVLQAELWGIYKGLLLGRSFGLSNLIVQSDSSQLVKMQNALHADQLAKLASKDHFELDQCTSPPPEVSSLLARDASSTPMVPEAQKSGRTDKLPPGPPTIPIAGNLFQLDALHALQHHKTGLPWMPVSTTWRNLRKICNLHIFASHKLDANRYLQQSKIEQLLADVHDSSRIGEAIDISTIVLKTSLNLMSSTVFSNDLADTSDTALEFGEIIEGIKKELGKPNFGDYFPTLLGNLDLQGIRRRMTTHFGELMTLFDDLIDKRFESRKMKDSISTNDLLDMLLQITGTETTTSTLEWAMVELLHNPKTLSDARRELQQKIGQGKMVDESDVTCLPYLQAIVKETLRLHPPVPLLLPWKVKADIEIHGFEVPKGAQVSINAWAIGRDPGCWEEPELFLPERFMGSDVDVKVRDFGIIPFEGGRRIRPELPLAMRMLHLVLDTLIHSFDWELEDGVTPENLNMDDAYGLVLQKARRLRVIPRLI